MSEIIADTPDSSSTDRIRTGISEKKRSKREISGKNAAARNRRFGLLSRGLTPVAKSSWAALAVAVILIAVMLAVPIPFNNESTYNTTTLFYIRGTVSEVTDEFEMTVSEFSGQKSGEQVLQVKLSDGRTVEVNNTLSDTHNIYVEKGDRVIVCADEPENAEPYYTLFNYDRSVSIALILLFFGVLMILIGGVKGLFSLTALAFSVVMLFRFTIPAIYGGVPAIGAALLSALAITALSVSLFTGFTRKSLTSGTVTIIGELIAVALFALFSHVLHFSGFVDENVDSLLVVSSTTGMDLKHMLYAAAIIASLGAVMDVAVSLVAAIWEIYEQNPDLSARELFVSGMTVGRDMMGTMSNTLILAFAGTALSMILVLYSYGVQTAQLLNSDYFAIELSHGLCGTMAVIITVPVASAASAIMLTRLSGKKISG